MENELRQKGFDEEKIINKISEGFISGIWNIVNNFDDVEMSTILKDYEGDKDINSVEFNIVRELIIELKRTLSISKMRVRTEVEYNNEGKKIVITRNDFEILTRTYYGVDIPSESEIISEKIIKGEILLGLKLGNIEKITTDKQEEFIRKRMFYKESSFSVTNNIPDINGGIGNLIREGIAVQMMSKFTKLAKAPDVSYNVFYNDKEKMVAEVYLEVVSDFKEFLIDEYYNKDKKLLLSELVQIGELIFLDTVIGNTDRMITGEFNGGNMLIDSNGRFNAIDTTFSVMNMYLIWLYREITLFPSEEFINNNEQELRLTPDNINKLLNKVRNEMREFIKSYKNEEKGDSIFDKVINNLLRSFKKIFKSVGITEEEFTKGIYAGIMSGIESVAKKYDRGTFPILDKKTLSGQELIVLKRVFETINKNMMKVTIIIRMEHMQNII